MKFIFTQQQKQMNQGFSLIEVLVSVAIFTVVVTISVGALMVLITANARAQNTSSLMTNVTYALDSMTRDMRTGSDYWCGSEISMPTDGSDVLDCEGGAVFSFNEGGKSLTANTANDSRRIAFKLEDGAIERRLGDGDWVAITSPEVIISTLRFYASGTSRGDALSPTVTLYIQGTAGAEDDSEASFNVQTTVVQQLLDI